MLSAVSSFDKLAILQANNVRIAPIAEIMQTSASGVDKLIPGASVLPAGIGSKLTIKNALIGGGIAVAAYLAYAVFLAPPKKGSTAPSSTSTISGLFGARRRRRRR